MDKPTHQFTDLFAQLGLAADEDNIAAFMAAHSPLPSHVKLPDAPFWTPAQSSFLREGLSQDSDWAMPIDQLSQALRGKTPRAT
jgi:hypothetical protein